MNSRFRLQLSHLCVAHRRAFYGSSLSDKRNEIEKLILHNMLGNLFSYDITHKLMDTIMKKIPEHVRHEVRHESKESSGDR